MFDLNIVVYIVPVDKLYDTSDSSLAGYWHTQDVPSTISGLLVHFRVKPFVTVRISDVDYL